MTTQISGTTGVSKVQDGVKSGLIADGAIIESGSNANGNYTKFADGTMLCSGVYSIVSLALNTVGLGGYRNTASSALLTFPAGFSVAPIFTVTPGADTGIGCSTGAISATTTYIVWTAVTTQAAATRTANWIAIGRWK